MSLDSASKVEPVNLERASDEVLLERYRDLGDVDSLETLIHRYEKPIYGYLFRYLHDAQRAEDVFQATFIRIHTKAHLYTSGRPVRPWLYQIATRCAIDALRRTGRHQMASLDEIPNRSDDATGQLVDLLQSTTPSPFAALDTKERKAWTRQAVAALPSQLRSVILLIYFEGLKYREVAETLGIPLGTVKSRAHQAILELNKAWRRSQSDAEESAHA